MIKNHRITLVLLILLTTAITFFIWSNSMLDGEGSGALSKKVTEFICNFIGEVPAGSFEETHHFVRKAAHFTEFAVLGMMYMFIKIQFDGKAFSTLLFFPVSCTLFTAVCDEFIQSFNGRGSSVRDVMLDFSGALTGILLTAVASAIMKKCNRKSLKM